MAISAEKLKRAPAMARERVELPEFGDGEYVWVYGMTAAASIAIEAWIVGPDGKVERSKMQEYKQRQIIASLRDDAGELLLTIDDIDAISQWPRDVFERVHDVVTRLNGASDITVKNDETTATG